MAIELTKINDLYNKSKKLLSEINNLSNEFKKVIHDDNLEQYLNPFNPTQILLNDALHNIEQALYLFFQHRFMNTYCPNLESIERSKFEDVFHSGEFDAISLIEYLKEQLLSRGDVEAYKIMRKQALSIFDKVYLHEMVNENMYSKIVRARGHISFFTSQYGLKKVKDSCLTWNSIVSIKQFEQFLHFVLDCSSISSKKMPPSQYKKYLPISYHITQLHNKNLPIDICIMSRNGPINRFKCFKNGNISFYFNSLNDVSTVMRALSGQFTPDFETVQIDLEEMFKLKPEYQNRARRVVKM